MQRDIEEASAWYAGDTSTLASFYDGARTPTRRQRAKFWSTRKPNGTDDRNRLHVPAAADVAATSADLLFGEAPTLSISEAHATNAPSGAKETEERLQELVDLNGLTNTLLEGAEVTAALGGAYLRPVWDPAIAAHTILTVVHADRAVPEFRWGILTAVTFWTVVHTDLSGSEVWRHLERHEAGVILHGLYAGDKEHLGIRRQLADHPATAGLAADQDGAIPLPDGVTGLAVRYVPNVLPNRKRRGQPVGRSDTAGVEMLMDALDETYSSWMRDIRIGKARIVVPDEFLDRRSRGGGASFDMDQEVFAPLSMDPGSQEKAGITPVEFKIRTDEHAATASALFERIVGNAGYSPQTFGLRPDERGDQTATEVAAREKKSDRTTGRKQRYWAPAVADVAQVMLAVDKTIFGAPVDPSFRPRLNFAEAAPDPKVTAETIELLRRAQAVSLETRVRMAQPHLDEDELVAEVARIREDEGLNVTDPTGGLP